MFWEKYAAFVMFAIVMTSTPGAGNLTMMAIGQNSGFRSSLPFLAGTTVGMIGLHTLCGLGVGALLLASPTLAWVMRFAGMAYILYLGWKILSMQVGQVSAKGQFTFLEGLVLHPTNPKSWAMSVVGFSQVALMEIPLLVQLVVFIGTFLFFQVTFHSLWGLAGTGIMRVLSSRKVLLGVNWGLVVVMVGVTAYALFV